mmetsp:Transcript_2662/g.10348  ORF Transcript_2662/g.10348 Transcript_2662/m.10348 type:complete len:300 (+) Transcript_2662:1840-2739(+)
MRRAYLRLALQYHPDKRPECERVASTELFQAIAAAYEELCESANRDAGGEASSRPPRVKSPVAAAAELGDLEELRRLLEGRPDRASEPDDLGIIPLMFAAAGGCPGAAEMLLDFGADLHARNPIGWSVLLYAALGNHAAMVNFLVERGAQVSVNDMVIASFTGNPGGFEALAAGYDGSICDVRTDQSRKTLLHLAVEGMCFLKHSAERHAACVGLALRLKVPVDALEPKSGRTCLQEYIADVRWRTRALENSKVHMEVVEQLCLHGASVAAEDASGQSALSLASEMGLMRVREILLSYA